MKTNFLMVKAYLFQITSLSNFTPLLLRAYSHVSASGLTLTTPLHLSALVCISPETEDRKNMMRILKYLNGTSKDKLLLLVDNLHLIKWYVDA